MRKGAVGTGSPFYCFLLHQEMGERGEEEINTKYFKIAEYAENNIRYFTGNKERWMRYLDTAARLYKYPFHEQMLIYAQRPDAAACASFETWNEKMSCRVNRGAKGIALPDLESGRSRLKYVFDIADVHAVRGIGHLPYLWKLEEEHKETVLASLEKTYGRMDLETTFEDRLMEMAGRITMDRYEDFLRDFDYAREGSALEELDGLNAKKCLRETLSSSIAYTLLSRCGADMSAWREELYFDYIHEFDTLKTLTIVGNATTEICRGILTDIGRTVRESERRAERERQWDAVIKMADEEILKKTEKGLANSPDIHYNALKRESKKKNKENIQEGIKRGTDIRESGRLSAAKPDAQRGTGGAADEIRVNEEELPERVPGRNLSEHDTDGRTESALSGSTGAGGREDGYSDRTDGESRGSDGEAEGDRPDEMGGGDEQHQALGGGDRIGRTDLRIDYGTGSGNGTQEPDNGEKTLSGSFSGKKKAAPGKRKMEAGGMYEQLDLFTMFAEQLGGISTEQTQVEKGDDFPDIDIAAVREKLENGEAAKEADAMLAFAEQAAKEAEAEKAAQTDKPEAVNFRITDDAPGIDTLKADRGFLPKEKFKRNMEAIRTLKKIEEENRNAAPEEQQILAQYVGWGGLADAFDESKSAWAGEYRELKDLLSPEDYVSARESTLNAFYTSPVIIRSIYETLGRMGFIRGNVLDPAAGIGNFFGCLPEKMQESRLYGVELDSITGRIARQLYPHADIRITGFEKTDYPNDFFDVAVGNVPFGQYKVADKAYDRHRFLIHDYFFAKTLDKVRPGGIAAFITSKGTMDKKSPEVRKYLAQRAELLGAVRLPNMAFKKNAGTEATSDILFFKKRDRMMDLTPDWVHLSEDADGIVMNSYFVEHPEMIVGKMEMVSGPYGMESACLPDASRPFAEQLQKAVSRIEGEIEEAELDALDGEIADQTIPADPDVKNYSYTLVNDRVYYRENSVMKSVDMKDSMLERIRGMIGIRDCTQALINVQLQEYPDYVIKNKQTELNELYDDFSKKYGLINSQVNKRAFNQDSSYCLLCSLERTDEEGKFIGKADMFTKRTIKKAEVVTSVDTAAEALAVSLSEKAVVDLTYMAELAGKDVDAITRELTGVIFQNPVTNRWETADEYLSGNVRSKLETAKVYAEKHPEYTINVQALTQVQPKELDASEIEVHIGATWIGTEYIEDFMRDTFETPQHLLDRNITGIRFSSVTGQWNVKGKNADRENPLVNMTYGTNRRNAYMILEDSLNLKDSRVYDIVVEDGKEKRVLNKKETTIAAQKQEAVREAFKDWVFCEPQRRQDLVGKYNKLFNSSKPREYDGAHLKFPGMTPDIVLKPHQKNAVAHVLYGNNTLLAHCVGAGKTFEMAAAAMESRRLGLCQKSLFVVPNHLTEQWSSDFLRLYPGANILAATKKDFEPANRKKFCSRIAMGDYDAVIIGHSQFEKIPLSQERQEALIERQIDEIEFAIMQSKADNGERYTIKQMEKTKKSLQARLEKLNNAERKDDVVTFEQLGVDRLFVDESQNYKNLFLYTKMRNVAGIAQTEAQKSSDMFAKCRYLDEITDGRGITFATGTPISNSMAELYTNMRYLQYDTLQRLEMGQFDSWASSFGETQTVIDIACQL